MLTPKRKTQFKYLPSQFSSKYPQLWVTSITDARSISDIYRRQESYLGRDQHCHDVCFDTHAVDEVADASGSGVGEGWDTLLEWGFKWNPTELQSLNRKLSCALDNKTWVFVLMMSVKVSMTCLFLSQATLSAHGINSSVFCSQNLFLNIILVVSFPEDPEAWRGPSIY